MNLANVLLLLLLAVLWGPSFLFIKVAVAEIPPITLVTGRVMIASLLLYIVLRLQGRNLPKFGPMWRHFAFMGLVHNAIPFVMFSWGEQHVDSALAGILNGTTPLFTIILAHFIFEDDRITPIKAIGTLIGFSGLVALVMPTFIENGFHANSLGLLAIAFAAICYAVAIIYSRMYMRGIAPLVAPTAQLGMAGLFLLPLSLGLEQPYLLAVPSWQATGSLLALAIFGTAIAFVVYYRGVETISASSLSTVTYIIPIISVILGVVVLGEELTWNTYLGCGFILLGVMIVNGVFKLKWPQLSTASSH